MSDEATYHAEIQKTVDANDVVIFMKGTKEQPMCGFSAVVVQIFNQLGVKFKDVNILADEGLRQHLRTFSDWPTFPQIYVKQEFIGGCDIIREMYSSNELQNMLKEKELL